MIYRQFIIAHFQSESGWYAIAALPADGIKLAHDGYCSTAVVATVRITCAVDLYWATEGARAWAMLVEDGIVK